MPTIQLSTTVSAPVDRVFDLSRSIDLHVDSMFSSRERPVAGVTSGLIGSGESVTWQARYFGLWFTLESRIVQFSPPVHFRDSMVAGPFKRFDHDHHFEDLGGSTVVRDVVDFTSPFGLVGRLIDRLFVTDYVSGILTLRNSVIKTIAESNEWQGYLKGRGHSDRS